MSDVVKLERRGDVALITIDSPPVNSLSTPVVEGIFARVAEANSDPAIKALVLTGAHENFIAGADITGLQALAEGGGKLDSKNIGALTLEARTSSRPMPSRLSWPSTVSPSVAGWKWPWPASGASAPPGAAADCPS